MGWFSSREKRGQPQHLAAITAAGATYRASEYDDFTRISLLRQKWQEAAFDMYDAEGHLFYATNYVGSAMSRIQLVGAIKPKKHGKLEQPQILESGPVADAIASIESPLGGQSGFLRQLGRNIFLTGEAWVIASTETFPDGSTTTNWDAVSIDELRSTSGNTRQRQRLPGTKPEDLPKGAFTFRIWKEHPRYSELADSGTRSCLELLEKIVILNRAEKAVARSQLAGSGILALPQELVPPAWQNQSMTPNPMESNPLWQALAESMMAPLRDENAPSSVVPLLLVGPGEIIKNMKYEPMTRTFDAAAAQGSISMAIEQIANTLELPKEILLGVGEATHWTAWAIREDVFQAHIQPLVELCCAGITRTFLKQALARFSDAELKKAGIDNRDDVIVWYDASELVIYPDKGDKMLGLHDRFIVTNDAVAEELGVPEKDRLVLGSEEYNMRIGVKMADPNMALTGKPPDTADVMMEKQADLQKEAALAVQSAKPAPASGSGGGAGPKGLSPGRGKSPQGPKAAPAKLPSERRAQRGKPQDSRTALTASASGGTLGEFDLDAMRFYRNLVERHARAYMNAVTAAVGIDLIADFVDEFELDAIDSWLEARSLMGSLGVPLYDSVITGAIKDAANFYGELIQAIVNKKMYGLKEPIFGEFVKGGLVQYGDIRPLLVRLGGGSPDSRVPLLGGIGSGVIMDDWLSANGIATSQKIWLYGLEEEPRRTFNGHLQMDGLVFSDWDGEGLRISPQDAWLRTTHYKPGDHWGCACIVSPYIPNLGTPYALELPSV